MESLLLPMAGSTMMIYQKQAGSLWQEYPYAIDIAPIEGATSFTALLIVAYPQSLGHLPTQLGSSLR